MIIRPLFGHNVNQDFLETLAALSEVNLTVEKAKDVFRDRLRSGIKTYIAIEDGRIVGTASLIVERKFLHGGSRAAHIEDVAVLPSYQRRGIGKALIMHLVQEARRLSCYKVVLDCKPDVVEFYQKCGFTDSSCQMRINL